MRILNKGFSETPDGDCPACSGHGRPLVLTEFGLAFQGITAGTELPQLLGSQGYSFLAGETTLGKPNIHVLVSFPLFKTLYSSWAHFEALPGFSWGYIPPQLTKKSKA